MVGSVKARFLAELASLYGRGFIPHAWGGAVLIAATLQLLALVPEPTEVAGNSGPFLEWDIFENPMRTELLTEPLTVKDGWVTVPAGRPRRGGRSVSRKPLQPIEWLTAMCWPALLTAVSLSGHRRCFYDIDRPRDVSPRQFHGPLFVALAQCVYKVLVLVKGLDRGRHMGKVKGVHAPRMYRQPVRYVAQEWVARAIKQNRMEIIVGLASRHRIISPHGGSQTVVGLSHGIEVLRLHVANSRFCCQLVQKGQWRVQRAARLRGWPGPLPYVYCES